MSAIPSWSVDPRPSHLEGNFYSWNGQIFEIRGQRRGTALLSETPISSLRKSLQDSPRDEDGRLKLTRDDQMKLVVVPHAKEQIHIQPMVKWRIIERDEDSFSSEGEPYQWRRLLQSMNEATQATQDQTPCPLPDGIECGVESGECTARLTLGFRSGLTTWKPKEREMLNDLLPKFRSQLPGATVSLDGWRGRKKGMRTEELASLVPETFSVITEPEACSLVQALLNEESAQVMLDRKKAAYNEYLSDSTVTEDQDPKAQDARRRESCRSTALSVLVQPHLSLEERWGGKWSLEGQQQDAFGSTGCTEYVILKSDEPNPQYVFDPIKFSFLSEVAAKGNTVS